MKVMSSFASLVIICITTRAVAEPRNLATIDPVSGVVGFTGKNAGEWSVGYERRVAPRHAVLVEQTTVHVHDDPFHLTVFGLGVGYRHHPRETLGGPLIGAVAGVKLGRGRFGHHATADNSLSARAAFATAHVGWRWMWSRVAFTVRIGAGYARYMIPDDAPAGAGAMADTALTPLPFELDSELGIGYAF